MHLVDYVAEQTFSPLNAPPTIVDRATGETSPPKSKVVIYGAGSGKTIAPLDDPTWEVWALNLIPPIDKRGRIRCDRWFDLHQRCAQTKKDVEWIAACPVPIYVPDDLLDVGPNCIRFPIELARVPGGPFACTFAYQIALALVYGVKEIGLFGVELSLGTRRERTVEWASVSWWMGYAEAKGVIFHLPSTSRLGRHPYDYGLEYESEKADVERYLARFGETNELAPSQGG